MAVEGSPLPVHLPDLFFMEVDSATGLGEYRARLRFSGPNSLSRRLILRRGLIN